MTLRGARVLITGSDGGRLAELLREMGARPIEVPTIAVHPVDPAGLDAALARAAEYAWIVVTSPNGARAVAERLAAHGARAPASTRWAAVGPRTAQVLRAAGIEPAVVPAGGTGVALAEALGEVAGLRVLLLRARTATEEPPRILRARGARVDEVVAYEIEEGPEASRAPLAEALAGGIEAAVFMSGSTVRGLARLAGDPRRALDGAVVVAIGPTTAAAAREAGLEPRTAEERTPESIVAALDV